MEMANDQLIQAYWEAFIKQGSAGPDAAAAGYQAWSFGSSPEMADDLGNLVVQGVKTATASLIWSYEAGDEPKPEVGKHSIILDGQGRPMCIILTTRIYVLPFDEVDEEQAYLEGEGDRSLQYWRDVHWKFFVEECHMIGREPAPKMPVLCERFTLVYRSN